MRRPTKLRILRWTLWSASTLLLILALGAAIMLNRRGPSPEELARLHRQYDLLRGRFPGVETSMATAATTAVSFSNKKSDGPRRAASANAATSQGMVHESGQARCDRLFRTILQQFEFMDARELTRSIPPIGEFIDRLNAARELAAHYDHAMYISPQARGAFKLPHARTLGLVADLLTKVKDGRKQSEYSQDELYALQRERAIPRGKPLTLTPDETDRLLDALRFIRVTGGPAWPACGRSLQAHHLLKGLLDSGGKDWTTLPPLPSAIADMDPNLLAPRDPDAWNRFMGLLLDMQREVIDFRADLARPGNFYDYARQQDRYWLDRYTPKGWEGFVYPAGEHCGTIFDTVVYHRERVRDAEREIDDGHRLFDYAARLSGGVPVRNLDETTFLLLRQFNERIEARALAAALELRRGRPIPAPGTVTPDSYFFDEITCSPLRLYRAPAGPATVRLHLVWPHIHSPQVDRSILARIPQSPYSISVLLPASHPGLSAVPEIK